MEVAAPRWGVLPIDTVGVDEHDAGMEFLVAGWAAAARLLLCSDGVSSALDPDRIGRELARAQHPQAAADAVA